MNSHVAPPSNAHKPNGRGLGIIISRPQPLQSRPVLAFKPTVPRPLQPIGLSPSYDAIMPSLRSQAGMRGLTEAETGQTMIEFAPDGSTFRSGQYIAPGIISPGVQDPIRPEIRETNSLDRQPTLFTKAASPQRKAAELRNILGSSYSGKLDSNAKILPPTSANGKARRRAKSAPSAPVIALEQAKSNSRVEVDLILDSGTCIEGGYLKGTILINIRPQTKSESSIYLGGGKVRVVGFEGWYK